MNTWNKYFAPQAFSYTFKELSDITSSLISYWWIGPDLQCGKQCTERLYGSIWVFWTLPFPFCNDFLFWVNEMCTSGTKCSILVTHCITDRRPDLQLLCFVQVTLFWYIWQIVNPLLNNHVLGLIQVESSNSPLISNVWIMFTLTDKGENIAGRVQTALYESSELASTVSKCLQYCVQGNAVLWSKGLNKSTRDFFVINLFFRFIFPGIFANLFLVCKLYIMENEIAEYKKCEAILVKSGIKVSFTIANYSI